MITVIKEPMSEDNQSLISPEKEREIAEQLGLSSINVHLLKEEKAVLDLIAKKRGFVVQAVIREAIDQYILSQSNEITRVEFYENTSNE